MTGTALFRDRGELRQRAGIPRAEPRQERRERRDLRAGVRRDRGARVREPPVARRTAEGRRNLATDRSERHLGGAFASA